MKNFRKTCE